MKTDEILGGLTVPTPENAIVLGLYLALLVVVIRVAVRYRRRALEQLERPQGQAPALALDELAFLSGGGQRVMQLATFRLFACKLLICEQRLFQQEFLPVESHDVEANRLTTMEQTLYALSCAKGKLAGMSDGKFRALAISRFEQIETKLAIAGYRPKESERSKIISRTMLPFLLLIAVGGGRIFYGISHGYPVWYLVILVILTLIIGLIVSNATPKLTRTGKALLTQQNGELQAALTRAGSTAERHQLAAHAVALSGAAGLVGFSEYTQIQGALQSLSANSGGDGATGTGCGSSGCGSSGCGSSGCGGGCGGGGD